MMKLPAASCGVSKRNCVVAKPAFALTSYGAVHLALHPCSPDKSGQGIRAKANKSTTLPARLNSLVINFTTFRFARQPHKKTPASSVASLWGTSVPTLKSGILTPTTESSFIQLPNKVEINIDCGYDEKTANKNQQFLCTKFQVGDLSPLDCLLKKDHHCWNRQKSN